MSLFISVGILEVRYSRYFLWIIRVVIALSGGIRTIERVWAVEWTAERKRARERECVIKARIRVRAFEYLSPRCSAAQSIFCFCRKKEGEKLCACKRYRAHASPFYLNPWTVSRPSSFSRYSLTHLIPHSPSPFLHSSSRSRRCRSRSPLLPRLPNKDPFLSVTTGR